MNQRKQKAKQMMETKGYCSQLDSNNFSVRSQTNPENRYNVSKTENGLKCDCKDHQTRKADCKHIKIVLEIINVAEIIYLESWNVQNYNYASIVIQVK